MAPSENRNGDEKRFYRRNARRLPALNGGVSVIIAARMQETGGWISKI